MEKETSRPMFSVIVPAFNRAGLIGQTIESVLAQTFDDYEIIVADDGSTDGTADVVRKLGPPVHLFTQSNNGVGSARNLAMAHARGAYFVFLDSDDLLTPWAFETFAAAIQEHGSPALVYGAEVFFRDGELAGLVATKRARQRDECFNCFLEAPPQIFWRSVTGNIVRADVARSAGQFVEERMNAEDTDFTLRCAAARGFVLICDPLTLLRRQHEVNLSGNIGMNVKGVAHLIQEEKAGRYPGGAALRHARCELVCFHARVHSLSAAKAGQTAPAWCIYRQVFWWSVRLGRWRYLLGLPIALTAGMVRKLLGQTPRVI